MSSSSRSPRSGSRTAKCVNPLESYAQTMRPSPRKANERASEHPCRIAELGRGGVEHRRASRRGSARGSTSRCGRWRRRGRPPRSTRAARSTRTRPRPRRARLPDSSPSGREVGDVQLAAVPRHPREVPGEEAEPRPVGGDARIRVEVAPAGDDARLAGAVGGYRDELVHDVRRTIALGMPLADADPERAVRRDAPVRVAMAPALRPLA